MTKRQVLIVGAGQRVLEAALPAFHRARDQFEVSGLVAKRARSIECEGATYDVRPLETLQQADVSALDLIYLVVAKDALPSVIERLTQLDVSQVDLLIETPVLRFRHFRHAARLAGFRNVWVSEDCSVLPWIDTVEAALAAGLIGELRQLEFKQSAYAYHGVAMTKTLLGSQRIVRGRRRGRERSLVAANGRSARIVEPRDYSLGTLTWIGSEGRISDRGANSDALQLACLASGDSVTGFQIGDVRTELDAAEQSLTYGSPAGASATARMDAMKRVGFLRLLRAIAAGEGAYPLAEGLDDMVIDYHLEKFRWFRANPFTSSRSALGRSLLSMISRAGG